MIVTAAAAHLPRRPPAWLTVERWAMKPNERWPLLSLVAGHIFNLGDPKDFHEIDLIDLDCTEAQLGDWIRDVAPAIEGVALKEKIKVTHYHRRSESPDQCGRQPWFDYVFVFDRSEVLVEEVLSYPLGEDISQPPARMRRFHRKRFADCPEEVQRLFPEQRRK